MANKNLNDTVKNKGVKIEMRMILSQPPFRQKIDKVHTRKMVPAISNGTRPVNTMV